MKAVILFDGECGFCRRAVETVTLHDTRGLFDFAPLQSAKGMETCRRHGLDPKNLQSLVVVSKGQALLRSDAVIEIARHLGGWPRLLILLRVAPRSWRDWIYDRVAQRRHWLNPRSTSLPNRPSKARETT